jgi:hypothetical protein
VETLVGLVSAGLVVAVILALYLSGPSVKASGAYCRLDSSFGALQAKVCIRKPGTGWLPLRPTDERMGTLQRGDNRHSVRAVEL